MTAGGPGPDVVARLLRHIDDRSTDVVPDILVVPASDYHDPQLAQREREMVYGRVPIAVALGTELPEPGDFLTVRLPGSELIVIRQMDRTIRAFVNSCRHRGAPLTSERSGHCATFTCRYHGWTYRSDGSLRAVAYAKSFGELDVDKNGLIEVPAAERHGIVWAIDRPGSDIDVAAWLTTQLDEALAELGLEDHECLFRQSFDEQVNWKILLDAFHDNYHLQCLHAKTIGPYIYTNTLAAEFFGPHVRFTTAQKSLDQARADGIDELELLGHLSSAISVFPALHLVMHPGHVEMFTITPHPMDPTRAMLDVRLLVRIAAGERDTALVRATKSWTILHRALAEDLELNRALSAQIQSRAAPEVRFGRNEIVNQHFHRVLAAFVSADSRETRQS
jgi:phenylpropionate dioxygenase-like ring-hydroxylating dioxygenase large terminal subunit